MGDMDMDSYQTRRRALPFSGYNHYDDEDMMYERRGGGPPKRRCLTDMEGPHELVQAPSNHAFQMVAYAGGSQDENHQLRAKILELEKRVSDLTATNEFLLDQNAQLRMGGKTAVPGPPVSLGHAQPSFILQCLQHSLQHSLQCWIPGTRPNHQYIGGGEFLGFVV